MSANHRFTVPNPYKFLKGQAVSFRPKAGARWESAEVVRFDSNGDLWITVGERLTHVVKKYVDTMVRAVAVVPAKAGAQ